MPSHSQLSLGRKKIQGVDTPSQRRYVHQLDALLKAQAAYLKDRGASGRLSTTASPAVTSSTKPSAEADGAPDAAPPSPLGIGALVRPPAIRLSDLLRLLPTPSDSLRIAPTPSDSLPTPSDSLRLPPTLSGAAARLAHDPPQVARPR